eukprot:SAG31_NODE_788_length_12088_cov_3.916090_3_plen_85_part_00
MSPSRPGIGHGTGVATDAIIGPGSGPLPAETTSKMKRQHRPVGIGDIGWGVEGALPSSSTQMRHFRRDGMCTKTTVGIAASAPQ